MGIVIVRNGTAVSVTEDPRGRRGDTDRWLYTWGGTDGKNERSEERFDTPELALEALEKFLDKNNELVTASVQDQLGNPAFMIDYARRVFRVNSRGGIDFPELKTLANPEGQA